MKPKAYFVLAVCVLLILAFSSLSKAFFNSDVKKAKEEFMAAGMYSQAVELLNKRINDKPTGAEAYYQLGICYINTGNFRGADERFASAVRLKADYGYKIGEEYQKAGSQALSKGNARKAQNLFRKAVQYQQT